jgi:hypothetical protein
MTVIMYGDPAYPNFTKWVDDLAVTTLDQATGHLVAIDVETGKPVGYCCLGHGCTLMPNLHLRAQVAMDEDGNELHYFEEKGSIFGEEDLAPEEFRAWLGVVNLNPGQADLYLDVSEGWGWLTQGRERLNAADGVIDIIGEGEPVDQWATCSLLNDCANLTFPQIADMLRYFGINGDEGYVPPVILPTEMFQ